ncbi:MAG: hypothetical protein KKD39_04320 [Candidatus Altiarchaeota archaeon]|nr:hypothetical protein [Candidatus Altiarchaeota archaeon]
MSFFSQYQVITPVVIIGLFWIIPRKYRAYLVLGGSYMFYGLFRLSYVFLLAAVTLSNYYGSIVLAKNEKHIRKRILFIILAFNLLLLVVFKYLDFLLFNYKGILGLLGITVPLLSFEILLPVGISFYTFQCLGYTIDVYKNECKATKKLLDFALFASFFPQLIAGPIESAKNLLPQIKFSQKFDMNNFWRGVDLIIWGIFKKLVIADGIGMYVDYVFSNNSSFLLTLTASFAFGLQIYSDFSAYTDIARGLGKLFMVDLMKNFNSPFLAPSPKEFFKRWHMSLYKWVIKYLFIPLGGSKKSTFRVAVNIMAVWLIMGLWHGASWTYVLWGVYCGVLVVISHFEVKNSGKIFRGYSGIFLTYTLINSSFLIFRSPSISYFFSIIANPVVGFFSHIDAACILAVITAVYSIPIILVDSIKSFLEKAENMGRWLYPMRIIVYHILISVTVLLAPQYTEYFIYFQF